MKKIFKYIYFTNLVIIIIALLIPIVKLLFDNSYLDKIHIGYYAVLTLLSITICITFIGLNLYGLIKYKQHRWKYTVITILLLIWIIWGAYQIINGFFHGIVL